RFFGSGSCRRSRLLWRNRCLYARPLKIKFCRNGFGKRMSELRITGVGVDVVRWPLKMKRRHGVGDIEESMPGAIVKISTDAGITGFGEAAPWSVFTGTAEANASGIHHYLRPLLIGADPLKIGSLMRQIEKILVGHTEG